MTKMIVENAKRQLSASVNYGKLFLLNAVFIRSSLYFTTGFSYSILIFHFDYYHTTMEPFCPSFVGYNFYVHNKDNKLETLKF